MCVKIYELCAGCSMEMNVYTLRCGFEDCDEVREECKNVSALCDDCQNSRSESDAVAEAAASCLGDMMQ